MLWVRAPFFLLASPSHTDRRLGYAERFIFETSKISQLFCHQIIWNMKANAYRGDAGEEVSRLPLASLLGLTGSLSLFRLIR